MIWFFERRGDHLRCEIRTQVEGDRYDLVITYPDGSEAVERFTDSRTLAQRTAELEQAMLRDGWNGPFARDW
jgi:hypothetical protein